MKKFIGLLVVFLSCAVFGINAEQLTVNFKASVTYSDSPDVQLEDIISGSFTYELTTSIDGNLYQDETPGSNITVELPNNVIYSTDPESEFKVLLYIDSTEVSPGEYSYHSDVESNTMVSSDGLESGLAYLFLAETINENLGSQLRSEWQVNIDNLTENYFVLVTNSVNIQATFIEISTIPDSPVTVDTYSHSNPISSSGGRLYFVRDVTNTSDETQEIKRWANITWADGTQYSRNRPTRIILNPLEQSVQTSSYFDVPAYWPAGEYTYNIYTITVSGGLVSSDSFTFTKSE